MYQLGVRSIMYDILEKEKSLMDGDWMFGYISTEFVDFK